MTSPFETLQLPDTVYNILPALRLQPTRTHATAYAQRTVAQSNVANEATSGLQTPPVATRVWSGPAEQKREIKGKQTLLMRHTVDDKAYATPTEHVDRDWEHVDRDLEDVDHDWERVDRDWETQTKDFVLIDLDDATKVWADEGSTED